MSNNLSMDNSLNNQTDNSFNEPLLLHYFNAVPGHLCNDVISYLNKNDELLLEKSNPLQLGTDPILDRIIESSYQHVDLPFDKCKFFHVYYYPNKLDEKNNLLNNTGVTKVIITIGGARDIVIANNRIRLKSGDVVITNLDHEILNRSDNNKQTIAIVCF